jgi:ribonucleoside-diphosphate reductase alpha chain
MAKEGSTIGGLMDAFGTAVSMSLQYGVPLEDYVRKFSHMRFEPQGYTKNPDIRIAKSLIDYIFRWLGITFLPGYKEASMGVRPDEGDGGDGGDTETETKPVAKMVGGLTGKTGSQGSGARSQGSGARSQEPGAGGQKSSGQQPTANGHTNGHANGHANGNGDAKAVRAQILARAGVMVKGEDGPTTARSEQFAEFQVDAPACDNCGAITVRNGNCYLCHNCGSSMGCS